MPLRKGPTQNLAEIMVAKHRNGPTHPGIQMVLSQEPGPLCGRRNSTRNALMDGVNDMPFEGFQTGKQRLTPIPDAFFSEVLGEIDHLGELKVRPVCFLVPPSAAARAAISEDGRLP